MRRNNGKWLVLDVHSVLIPGSERTIVKNLARHFGRMVWLTELRWLFKHKQNQIGKLSSRSFYGYIVDRNLSKKEFDELVMIPYSNRGHIPKEIQIELKKLKELGWNIGILSNMTSAQAEWHRKNKTFDLFDLVFLSCDLGIMKPFPKIYSVLEKKINVSSDRIVFGDDFWLNVITAYLMGWHSVKIRGRREVLRFLKDLEKIGVKE